MYRSTPHLKFKTDTRAVRLPSVLQCSLIFFFAMHFACGNRSKTGSHGWESGRSSRDGKNFQRLWMSNVKFSTLASRICDLIVIKFVKFMLCRDCALNMSVHTFFKKTPRVITCRFLRVVIHARWSDHRYCTLRRLEMNDQIQWRIFFYKNMGVS